MATETTKFNKEEKEQLLEYALPVGTILTSSKRTYKIKGVLGVGGFGITYRVSSKLQEGNIEFEHDFAIKEHFMKGCERGNDKIQVRCATTLKKDFEQGREDFIEEANRLHKLSRLSDSIVRVNENFIANGTAYYVMEYLNGGDLIRYVQKNGALSEGRALSLLVPIARAVAKLHEARLLHLDIKPDNIVLKVDAASNSIIPVLIDFGISKHFDRSGKPTSKLIAKGASDGYAPMEQYTEITSFSPEIDVYALGATLYYLLTGKNPPKAFDISSISMIRQALPADISDGTKNAITGAMQRTKFDRTPNVKVFLSSIEKSYTLPLGYVLNAHGKRLRIVEILKENSFSLMYRANEDFSLQERKRDNSGGVATVAPQNFIIVEYFCKSRDQRLEDGVTSSNNSRWDSPEHVSFIEDIVNRSNVSMKQVCEFYGDEYGLSWQFVKTNGTDYYIYEVVPKPPLPWRKILTYVGIGIGVFLFVVGTINIINSYKEARLKKELEMSQSLTNAIATNNVDTLRFFAEDCDSTRAYLPYARICIDRGDIRNAERYIDRYIDSANIVIPRDSDEIFHLRRVIKDKKVEHIQLIETEMSDGEAGIQQANAANERASSLVKKHPKMMIAHCRV